MSGPTFEIRTTDGIFLALRYDVASAIRCAEEFKNRWPQGVIVVEKRLDA